MQHWSGCDIPQVLRKRAARDDSVPIFNADLTTEDNAQDLPPPVAAKAHAAMERIAEAQFTA